MEAQKIIRIIDGVAHEIELTLDECRLIAYEFQKHDECEEIKDLIDRVYEGYEPCGEPDVDDKYLDMLQFLRFNQAALQEINSDYRHRYYNREDGDWEYDCIKSAVERYINRHTMIKED